MKELFKNDELLYNNYLTELLLTDPIKTVLYNNLNEVEKITSQVLLINLLIQFDGKFEKLEEISEEFLKLRSGKKLYEYFLKHEIKYLTDEFRSRENIFGG